MKSITDINEVEKNERIIQQKLKQQKTHKGSTKPKVTYLEKKEKEKQKSHQT